MDTLRIYSGPPALRRHLARRQADRRQAQRRLLLSLAGLLLSLAGALLLRALR